MNYNKMVELKKLREYLLSKGWKVDKFDEALDKIKNDLDGEKFEILIPNKEDLLDYGRRINDLINSLGSIEGRSIEELFNDIINFGYDLISFKFKLDKDNIGTMPLEYAGTAMKRISDIIKFGACSELNPKSSYKNPYNEAKNLVKNCELAQTEVGSFIINVRVPLDKTYISKEDKKEEYLKDLGRRTIKRLIEGFNEVEKINLSEEETFRKEYKETINKQICDSMSEILIKEDNKMELEITAKWNPSKEIEKNILSSIKIAPSKYFKKFKKMSVYLKKITEDEEATVFGQIVEMRRQEEDSKKEKRLVKIYDKKLKRNIYAWLEDENYKKACNSHRDKEEVTIKGILTQKKNGRWFLDRSQFSNKKQKN